MDIKIEILHVDTIPKELKIGQKYHVSWAAKGCVWVLKGFYNNGDVDLETLKTKRTIRTASSSLRLLNEDALKAANERIQKLYAKQLKLDL